MTRDDLNEAMVKICGSKRGANIVIDAVQTFDSLATAVSRTMARKHLLQSGCIDTEAMIALIICEKISPDLMRGYIDMQRISRPYLFEKEDGCVK